MVLTPTGGAGGNKKTSVVMEKEEEKGLPFLRVQEILSLMPQNFDSHDFIRKFIWECPKVYGELLIKYENVSTAHAEISNYLRYNASKLGIKELDEKTESEDIFKTKRPCANWEKTVQSMNL